METRRSPRIEVELKIISRIKADDKQKFAMTKGNVIEAKIVDISILGIGIVVKYFLPKGLIILLEMDGVPFGIEKLMVIEGEVRYCRYINDKEYRCGIQFINISEEYKSCIADFISRSERRKAPRLKLSD